MGFTDLCNYVLFDNPVSKTILKVSGFQFSPLMSATISNPPPEIKVVAQRIPLWDLAAQQAPIMRVAGICGATAVMLGAYGSHKSYPKDNAKELKSIYETGSRYHFIHTLALLGAPMCTNPRVTASLLILGTTLFSGPCYYHAFTADDRFGRLAPIGGTVLILAWLSMAL